jgi:hypothetical protein
MRAFSEPAILLSTLAPMWATGFHPSAASARVSLHSSPSPARPESSASFMGATPP